MDSSAPLDPRKVVLGFLVTPAIAPIAAIAITFVVTKEHRGECLYGWIVALTISIGFAASYITALVFAVPWFLIMRRMAGCAGRTHEKTARRLAPRCAEELSRTRETMWIATRNF